MDKKQLNNEICAVINRAANGINNSLESLKRYQFYTDRFCFLSDYDVAMSKKMTACTLHAVIALASESLEELEAIDEN